MKNGLNPAAVISELLRVDPVGFTIVERTGARVDASARNCYLLFAYEFEL